MTESGSQRTEEGGGGSGGRRLRRAALLLVVLALWMLGIWRFLKPPVDLAATREIVFSDMVHCPAGVLRTLSPPAEVPIREFWIDRFEVTRREYARFLRAHPRTKPPIVWPVDEGTGQVVGGDLPVAWVTLPEARAYARWAGKRLPTSEEWEWAARGAKGTRYPWGAAPRRDVANTAELGVGGPTPVGLFEDGRSFLGLYDLVGNVWEWTSSRGGREVPDRYFVRGGSFRSLLFVKGREPTVLETHVRNEETREWNPDERVMRGPRFASGDLGFRCVLDGGAAALWESIEDLGCRDPVGYVFQVLPAMQRLRSGGGSHLSFLRRVLRVLEDPLVRRRLEEIVAELEARAP